MKQQTKILTIGSIAVLVALMAAVYYLGTISQRTTGSNDSNETVTIPSAPSITGVSTSTDTLLAQQPGLLESDPPNLQTDVPTSLQTMTFVFDRPVSAQEITVEIVPEISHRLTVDQSTITLTFQEDLEPATEYLVELSFLDDFLALHSFVTVGLNDDDQLPDTYPENMIEIQDEFNRSSQPDIFVQNMLPVENQPFTVEGRFDAAQGGYIFTVTGQSSLDELEQQFREWLISIGLGPQQIETLIIRYEIE